MKLSKYKNTLNDLGKYGKGQLNSNDENSFIWFIEYNQFAKDVLLYHQPVKNSVTVTGMMKPSYFYKCTTLSTCKKSGPYKGYNTHADY